MNRLPKDFFESLKLKDISDIHVLECSLPETMQQVNTLLKSIVDTTVLSCKQSKIQLAPIACGLVSADGFMPSLVSRISENMNIDRSKLGLCMICALGTMFAKAECESIKDDLVKEGMELPSIEWIANNRKTVSFLYACHSMSEIACDCPACILFWCGKRSGDGASIPTVLNEVIAVCNLEKQRHGDGCIMHLIPESNKGKWVRGDDDV